MTLTGDEIHALQDPALPEWIKDPSKPASGLGPVLPETLAYRVKRRLLGPPLSNDQLHTERLGKPTALAVLSSDVMSSCAYASESILRILIPAAGIAAFTLVTPVTLMLLVVLGLVCLCYRQVVKAYPVSGGSYVVSRENFGYSMAQIPAAALVCSYVLTVAVSVAAGVDAVISAFPVFTHYPVELSVFFVLLLTFGNLRGIREAGRVFAIPTYWFLASMAGLLITGLVRVAMTGHLHHYPLQASGHVPVGTAGGGLLLGASAFIFLRAFANGGSAMTGMEAISNSVSIFREPQVRNARITLVLMAAILGVMFVGVSVLSALTHAVPFEGGTPTVLSQIGRAVFGQGTGSNIPYYSLQFSTALILILGANTSFNGFPLLVSFIATDAYLPRPLTTRGHRLVYSNGILVLAFASLLLLVVTRAQVASLIPLYACTVFTGFTMAGAGMTKYHWTHHAPHRGRNLAINGTAFVASAGVTAIFVVTEFTRGAWLVVIAIPLIVFLLTRTHRAYQAEKRVLAEDLAAPPVAEPTLRRHVVLVLVDRLDMATARALQLASSLTSSGDVRAVHFAVEPERGRKNRQVLAQARAVVHPARDRRVSRSPHRPRRDRARSRARRRRRDRGDPRPAAPRAPGHGEPVAARPHLGPDRVRCQSAATCQCHDRAVRRRGHAQAAKHRGRSRECRRHAAAVLEAGRQKTSRRTEEVDQFGGNDATRRARLPSAGAHRRQSAHRAPATGARGADARMHARRRHRRHQSRVPRPPLDPGGRTRCHDPRRRHGGQAPRGAGDDQPPFRSAGAAGLREGHRLSVSLCRVRTIALSGGVPTDARPRPGGGVLAPNTPSGPPRPDRPASRRRGVGRG